MYCIVSCVSSSIVALQFVLLPASRHKIVRKAELCSQTVPAMDVPRTHENTTHLLCKHTHTHTHTHKTWSPCVSLLQDSDVYSLGVLLWEAWSGECPWPDLSPPQLGRVLVEEGQRLPLTKKHFVISHILESCFGPPMERLPIEHFLCQVGYLKTTPLQ